MSGPCSWRKSWASGWKRIAAGGSVVLLSTMQAHAVFPLSLNYAAPKAALAHAALILAQQWKQVRVNVVAPGATQREWQRRACNRENMIVTWRAVRLRDLGVPKTWRVRYDSFWNRTTTSRVKPWW